MPDQVILKAIGRSLVLILRAAGRNHGRVLRSEWYLFIETITATAGGPDERMQGRQAGDAHLRWEVEDGSD